MTRSAMWLLGLAGVVAVVAVEAPARDRTFDDPPAGPAPPCSRGEAFDRAFPPASRHKIYTYDAFVQAAAAFPRFCGEGSAPSSAVAASWPGSWATSPTRPGPWKYAEEINKGDYRQASSKWPAAPGKKYFGRGPLQLSWNYNYGMAGEALHLDLLGDPDLVARDGVVAFKTSLWFWMTGHAPRPSCHEVLTGAWKPDDNDVRAGRLPGFGMTVVLINGMEAGKPGDRRVLSRIRHYETFAKDLDVPPGDNVSCEKMKAYGSR